MTSQMTMNILDIGLGFILGCIGGYLHFMTLKKVTALYLGGRVMIIAIALQMLRLGLLAVLLLWLATLGAGPLLAGAVGIFLARAGVVRHTRGEMHG